jgi:hypothetical protein
VAFGWAALVTVVLVAVGIGGVVLFNDRLKLRRHRRGHAHAHPAVTAAADGRSDIPVTVLNGTTTAGLAARAGETLTAAGIPVGTTANASENDLTETVVYYATADLEGAARGVAAAIPEADVRLSEQFAQIGTPLVLVVGSDYATATGG